MPYEIKVDKAEKAINEVLTELGKDDRIELSEYKGVNNFKDSNIDYLILVKCKPINKLAVRRDTLRTILVVLGRNKIEIPYQQIDVHTK